MKSRMLLALLLGGALLMGAAAAGTLTSRSQGAVAPGTGTGPNDALTAARFEITIGGQSLGMFSELQGISTGIDAQDLDYVARGRETTLTLPEKRVPPTITLKRGMSSSLEISAWHEQALLDNLSARKTVTLVMYDAAGSPVARYHLEQALPSKLEIGALKAGGSDVLMETVTLVAEHIQRVTI